VSKVVVVTSGKGGRKTTRQRISPTGLALKGLQDAAVDSTWLRNLDLVLGCERRVVYDSSTSSRASELHQGLIRDRDRHPYVLAPRRRGTRRRGPEGWAA